MTDHNEKKIKLMKWLNKKCRYSKNIFKDPGYSEFYKRNFNITDDIGPFSIYKKNDIDHLMNIGYVDYAYNDQLKHEDDGELEQFIDYIPKVIPKETLEMATKNRSFVESEDIIKKMTRHNMVILPGTNHSNANFLYKELLQTINDLNYHIPYVNIDPSLPYEGTYKIAKLNIDKESFYNFLRINSKN